MFIGIDLGTSSIKSILIDENQKIIGNASISLNLSNHNLDFMNKIPKVGSQLLLNVLKN